MQGILYRGLIALLLSSLVMASELQATNITRIKISSYILPNKTLNMQMDVVMPTKKGNYPAILFLTGLSGLAPEFMQTDFTDSVAVQGFVMMTLSKLQAPLPSAMTNALEKVIDWMLVNVQSYINKYNAGVIADLNDLILMGHSAAAHPTTQYLNSTCGPVKLQILLDPVDGVDPFGVVKEYITHPGQLLPYSTPVLVVQTELDPVPATIAEPPCAADNISNIRYYNAMRGPKWFLNISQYGHADFFNDDYRVVASAICKTCEKNCDYKQFRTLWKDVVTTFVKGILQKSRTDLDWIEKSQFVIPTINRHDYMGHDPLIGGFCTRANQPHLQSQ